MLLVEGCKTHIAVALVLAKGQELDASIDVLSTLEPQCQTMLDVVCTGFAMARDLDYIGVEHLAEAGTPQEAQLVQEKLDKLKS